MHYYRAKRSLEFIGRENELSKLKELDSLPEASLLFVYGRRRVGKTELLEQFFIKHDVLKFEGIQPDAKLSFAEAQTLQLSICLNRLADYSENKVFNSLECTSWTNFFKVLTPYLEKSAQTVLYFEEIQWLSGYSSQFFSELKPFWDDIWRHVPNLRVVFCGSAPSFVIEQLKSDKALYGRSTNQLHVKPFSIVETHRFLKLLGPREAMLAELTIGGIPEYLKLLKSKKDSVLSSLCRHSFLPDSYFATEYEKIFVSSLASRPSYRKVIETLSAATFLDRERLSAKAKISSGGNLTDVIEDLTLCGFIDSYSPLHLGENSKHTRYTITDSYIQFYNRFIRSQLAKISAGDFVENPSLGINRDKLDIILGFSFERWCRKNSQLFAKILGFDRIEYKSGAFFNKKSDAIKRGTQIDLAYIRADSKILICEIKYKLADYKRAYKSIDDKVAIFKAALPRYQNYTFERILIAPDIEPSETKLLQNTFDHIITFEDIWEHS